jgi:hypothetical protein
MDHKSREVRLRGSRRGWSGGLPSTAGHQEARERRPWWRKVLGRYMKDAEGKVTVLAVVIAGVVAFMVEKVHIREGTRCSDSPC